MEVCIDSVRSGVEAENGGAIRLELCSNLAEGGTTPSLGLFTVLKSKVKIPVFVMIRPRGGDFLYSDEEFAVMKKEIEIFKAHGADGFVFGLLTKYAQVDVPRSKELLNLAHPSPMTFHRAFDMVKDCFDALEDVISIGCQRILTSGCEQTAFEGLETLAELVKKANGRVIIMPGGGINSHNLSRILHGCKANEFHCSARKAVASEMIEKNTQIHMGAAYYPPEYSIKVADSEVVSQLVTIWNTTDCIQ